MNRFIVMVFELELITLEEFCCFEMVVVNLEIFGLEILMETTW